MAGHYDHGEANETTTYGEPHPYDAPFAFMMAMQKDIYDLRQALHAEQQQRAQEVLELKQEVTVLREALKKEIAERSSVCHKFNLDITKLQSNSGKGVDELKAVHRKQLGQLNQMLQDEIRDRRASEALRDTRESSALSERAGEMTNMTKELNAHKASFYAFKDEQVNLLNNVVHDIEAIVAQVSKIGYASESFRSVSFITEGNAMLNSRPDPDDIGGPMTSMRNRSMSPSVRGGHGY
mmetsp:Transcript_84948/g.177532  ORF Transcript_84948/g.177532 Transcript_84948/m.177532 type:complete len:238 (+) Transcript_84948:115-828(+)|eukprot:CAMPEP_0206437630 /NCGR_PEP_ID=MMETSP0324_2-20121206/11152_1 /ASSEMBLY_ACC=CAM_ASM_000836 /TAXON_ID=2866 /ORGANISM="Crypthecodinium cohnii, Strain Seligo" /LENGTH=237 /DNA_ID=CAMNT_0053904941 /DNA_START=18 /DNA_END=731 /DNA_ORIENTATION=+